MKRGTHSFHVNGKAWRVRLVLFMARRAYNIAYRLDVLGTITFTIENEVAA